MNKGFTLIELLVVVLIIGILAAIALPQYTKAVERSRLSEAVQVLGDLATAESIYFMQNNVFAEAEKGETLPGDISIVLPDNNKRWEVSATAVASSGSSVKDGHALLTAERKGGMYDGHKLFLKVNNDGAITKCVSDGGFDGLAGTAGYTSAPSACSAS